MNRRQQAGFTLLEIVLVVVIIGIASAVAVPMFARSFRGARLRNSTRMITMMHRHAQSKAVLGQRYMALLFDEVKGTVELVDQGQPGVKQDVLFGSLDGGSGMGTEVSGGEPAPDDADAGDGAVVQSQLQRSLEDGVNLSAFSGGREIDGIHYVSYYPNGMCDAYSLEIADNENRRSEVKVDPVTGKVKVTRE